MNSMRPRWKGKGSSAIAIADPMSKIVARLQSSLMQSKARGLLSDHVVLLEAGPEQIDLLNRACFGRPIITGEKDKQWFQLGFEEAFFLSYSLVCLSISNENSESSMTNERVWGYMKSQNKMFPNLYKAYSHLRAKNWVVRSGSQYGADFVVYRHHPALVHSEFAVLVLSDGDCNGSARLRVWSDLQCMLRLCGSVAKTLLVLNIDNGGGDNDRFPMCLESCCVGEYTITRWITEQHREDHLLDKDGNGTAISGNGQRKQCLKTQFLVLETFLSMWVRDGHRQKWGKESSV